MNTIQKDSFCVNGEIQSVLWAQIHILTQTCHLSSTAQRTSWSVDEVRTVAKLTISQVKN